MAIVSKEQSGGGPVLLIVGWIAALAFLALVVVLWSVASQIPNMRAIVPSPGSAWASVTSFPGQAITADAIAATLGAWLYAFVLAAVVGLFLGVLAGRSRGFAAVAAPSGFLFAAFPVVFVAPLCIVAYGVNTSAGPALTGALLALGPVVVIAAWGQRAENSAGRVRSLFRALEFAALLALSGAIFAEMFGSQVGLGVELLKAFSTLDVRRAFAIALLIWTLAIVLTLPFAILRWLLGRTVRA